METKKNLIPRSPKQVKDIVIFKSRLSKLIHLSLILVMMGNMILLPQAAQARQGAVLSPRVTAIVEGGERLMDAAPLATGNGLQLAQLLAYLNQTDLQELNEATLVQARQQALTTTQVGSDLLGHLAQQAIKIDTLLVLRDVGLI